MTEPPRGPADPRPTTARDPKRTSERQIAANRENAKKSTGPRAAGKQRSSQNATKAGLWAQELRPISRGPFREDGDEFYARAEAQINELAPIGELQHDLAKRASGALARLRRTDRLEEALLDDLADKEAQYEVLHPLYLKGLDAVIANTSAIAGRCAPDDQTPWWKLAVNLRIHSPDPHKDVPDVWEDPNVLWAGHTPKTADEWKAATEAVFGMHWRDEDDLISYLTSRKRDALERHSKALRKTRAAVASDLLGESLENVDRARTAAWTEFRRAYDQLRDLQARAQIGG